MSRAFLILIFVNVWVLSIPAVAKSLKSSVVASAQEDEGSVVFKFKIETPEGVTLQAEGPWKLEVLDPGPLEFSSSPVSFDPEVPGFTLRPSKAPNRKSGTLTAKIKAYICNKAEGWCRREVHDQIKVRWNVK